MLDWIFIMLLMIAILFTMMSIITDFGIFWNVIFILVAIIIFIILSAGIHELETPYQMYNATSGNIETGYQTIYKPMNTYLSYLFMLFSIVMIIYFVGYIIGPAIYKKWMR